VRHFEALIQKCDTQIREGRAHEVAATLAGIEAVRVPRQWKMPLAKICRRAGLHSFGLTLLSRLIHPAAGRPVTATPTEFAEYAMLLLRSGAAREAWECLSGIDPVLAPESSLYRAYVHFTRWEFAESVPHLQTYLATPLAPYAKLVGQTNLAYAYVESRQHDRAVSLLTELITQTAGEGHHLLESNCRAYLAQAYFQQEDFSHAREQIVSIQQHSGPASSNDQLIVEKWKLILDAVENQKLEPLLELHKLASTRRDWATLREVDFFKLKIQFEKGLYWHLYFGTPFPSLRQRLEREFGITPDRDTYVFGKKLAPRFDLRTGQIDSQAALKPGRMTHRLLELLLRDFYQPLRIGELFSELFLEEFFSPATSPDRVHQLISRTRRWLKDHKIPVAIEEIEGFYSLAVQGNFSFRVPLQRGAQDPLAFQFEDLVKQMRTQNFTAKDVGLKMKLPRTTVFRILTWAIENKKIERLGSSPNTYTYRVIADVDHLQEAA
jgi:tetratricopeptide (TPR) repeat protein